MSSTEIGRNSSSEGLQIPGLVQDQDSVEQLSFTVNPLTPTPLSTAYQGGPASSPGLSELETAPGPISQPGLKDSQIPQPISAVYSGDPQSSPDVSELDTARRPVSQANMLNTPTPLPASTAATTRALIPESQFAVTKELVDAHSASNTTALRPPVVIRGSNQRKARSIRPPQGRRHVIGIAALVLLLVITSGTLFAVSPLGRDAGLTFGNSQASGSSLIQGTKESNLNLVAQATATAVVHQQTDGFDPNSNGSGPVVTGSPHPWPVGVCTYWANLRYHQLTGNWVTWTGNAYQWADGARLAGWHVSSSPHVPSIIVLMPGVQGASGFGHVAVVESASGNTAHTSNMNWFANGGGYDIVSYYDFTAGSGVYFIWK